MARLSLALQIFLVCLLVAVAVEGGKRKNKGGQREKPKKNSRECKGARRMLNPNCVKTKRKSRSVIDEDSTDMIPEEFFFQLDTNEDKMIDVGEWFSASPRISIREFVRLLDEADVNDDEQLSLPEWFAGKFHNQGFRDTKPDEEVIGSR